MKNQIKLAYDKLRILILYAFAFFVLFTIQKHTLGLLPVLRDKLLFEMIYLKDLLFTVSSLVLVLVFIEPTLPDPSEKKHFLKIERVRNSH
ncbi:hypothetical protein JCM15765_14520 [Paradesulfitobacterium aromaticivorans]